MKQTPAEQARLIELIHSNSVWDGTTLRPIYRKPFDVLAEGLQSTTGGADDTFTQTVARRIRAWKGNAAPAGDGLTRLAACERR